MSCDRAHMQSFIREGELESGEERLTSGDGATEEKNRDGRWAGPSSMRGCSSCAQWLHMI